MIKVKPKFPQAPQAIPQSAYRTLAVKFILTWVVSMVLLMAVALMINIDWARPQVQSMMSHFFNRRVQLGKLSVAVGFNGLSIDTGFMRVTDTDGKPFLHSGKSKIGVAILPLLQGELKIRRLSFEKPELWAVRLADNRWNFSDLLHPVDVRFLQIKQGQLHIRDKSRAVTGVLPSYDFSEIDAKIVSPRKNHAWPFQLSFSLPRPGYTSRVKLRVFGRGELKDWQQEPYGIDLISENLNPDDLGPYKKYLPPLAGLYNLQISGQGRYTRKVEATVQATVNNLSLPIENARVQAALAQVFPQTLEEGGSQAQLHLKSASLSSKLSINKDLLSWDKLTIKSGNSLLESDGQISLPLNQASHYRIQLNTQISDLNDLNRLLSWDKDKTPGWWQRFNGGRLAGKVNFQLEVQNRQGNPLYQSRLKVENFPARQALVFLPDKQFAQLTPWISDPGAKLNGQISLGKDGRLSTSDLNLAYRNSTVRFSGNWKENDPQSQINFAGENFNLADLSHTLLSHPGTRSQLSKWLDLPPAKDLEIRGHLSLSGRLSPFKKGNQMLAIGELKNLRLHLHNQHLLSENIQGTFIIKDQALQIQKLTGKLDGSNFSLQGNIKSGFPQPANLRLQVAHLDLNHLITLLKIARVKFPLLSDGQLNGRLADLWYETNTQGQAIKLSVVPESIQYLPVKATRPPIKISGGLLRWENNQLTGSNLELSGKQSRLTLSFAIDNLNKVAVLKRLRFKSAGCDLAELHNHLISGTVPATVKSAYLKFTNHYHLLVKQGRLYGDLIWEPQNKSMPLQGTAGIYNVKATIGSRHYPLDRVSGLLAVSGPELLVQDLSGSLGHSSFIIDGHATNYRRPGLSWQMNLRSWVFAEDLHFILSHLNQPVAAGIQADAPLALRAHISGNDQYIQSIFSAQSAAKSNLRLVTKSGSLTKPAGETLALDGSIEIQPGTSGSLNIKNSHLLVGKSVVRTYGRYSWFAPESKQEPVFDLQMLTPNPIPAATLVALYPAAGQQLRPNGSWQGNLHLTGNTNKINVQGDLNFNDLKSVKGNISLSKGHVDISTWTLLPDNHLNTSNFDGRITITGANFNNILANQITSDIHYQNNAAQNELWLPNLTAQVFSGKLNLSVRNDLNRNYLRFNGDLHKADANQLLSQTFGCPGELSGSSNAAFAFEGRGKTPKEFLSHLNGTGTISITGGKVTRFGHLQEKITQANLLRQGLFGFNLNNLLQSVVPVRTGHFKELGSHYQISQGLLSLSRLRFNGDDMRLWGAGQINLPQQSINVKIAGNVPRVSSSLLSGPVGKMSKRITLQSFMKLVTGGAFESLPPLPLIGEISGEKPRAFAFNIEASLTKAKEITQSIEKSFHWLPNRLNASAHPVPELQ